MCSPALPQPFPPQSDPSRRSDDKKQRAHDAEDETVRRLCSVPLRASSVRVAGREYTRMAIVFLRADTMYRGRYTFSECRFCWVLELTLCYVVY